VPDRLRIELTVAATAPIRGELDDGSGAARRFEGWLELISAIQDSCREAHNGDRPAEGIPPARRSEA
jgi:hypothetical protein